MYRSGSVNTANNVTSSDASFTTFVLSPRSDASGSLLISELSNPTYRTDYNSDGTMGIFDRSSPGTNQHHTIRGILDVAPTINTPAGSYPSTQYVNITLPASESAFIAYTTDGSDPKTSATRVISTSNTSVDVKLFNFLQTPVTVTVKACAYKPGFYESSVVSADYTLAASTTQWFYLQFANGGWVVADQGAGTNLKTAAKADGTPAQLWSIQEVTPGSKTYILTSALGNKINFANNYYTSDATTGVSVALDNTINATYAGNLELRRSNTAANGVHMNMYQGAGSDKLISEYTFGDNGNPLRLVPLPAYGGNALNFNGINNYMRIPHNDVFNYTNTQEFSITYWVNVGAYKTNARMIAKRDPSNSGGITGYELWGTNSSSNFYAINTPNGSAGNFFSVWGTGTGSLSNWIHIGFTVSGIGTARKITMYQNGVKVAESTADITNASSNNTRDVLVGFSEYPGSAYFQGKMDNIRFWNKGLTQSEVETDQTSIVSSSTPNLIAAYDFSNVDLNAMTVADIKNTYTAYLHNYDVLSVSNLQQFGMTGRGNSNDPILRATTVVSATDAVGQPITSVSLVNAILNLSGTTNLSDITSLKVYSTGSNVNFDPRDPVGKGAVLLGSCSPASGDITCTLTGTLATGTHYLWVTADVANGAAEGNQIDIALKSITFNTSTTHTLSSPNPTGTTNILLARKLIVTPGDAGSANYRIPSLITAADGSLLVFTDKRKYNNSDLPQDIDVVVHRSTDNGKTWSAATTIATGTGVGAGFGDVSSVVTRSGKIVIIFAGGPGFLASTASNPLRIYKSESTNNGITWTAPTDITTQIYGTGCTDPTRAAWLGMFISSGRMLYTSSGRIMEVGLVRDGTGTNKNYVVYSDDEGATWSVASTYAISGGDEAKIMELANGTFMVTSRKGGTAGRLKATSADGLTWSGTSTNIPELVEPGCNGDFIRYSKISEGASNNILLHSIPNNSGSRRNVSVFVSTDEGATWPTKKSIVPETMTNNGSSGYSSLTVLPDGTIGAYVEVENYSGVYEMYFMNFSLGWLTGNSLTFTENRWIGTANTDFNTPSNWARGVVPSTSSDITIASYAVRPLVINSTVTLGNVTVNAGKSLTVTDGNTLNVGNIKLLSNGANGTATVTGNVSGTAQVEQNLSAVRNWYMSSPVATGKMPAAGHWYNETLATNNWEPVSANADMTVGRGYIVVPVTTGNVSFSGALNNGNQSIALTRTDANTSYKGFNLVGNPYPSFLNAATFLSENSASVDNNIWYRTHTGTFYQFQTYNSISDVSVPKASNGSYIPPMQAFWVRAKANGVNLNFNNAMRKHNDSTVVIRLRAPKAPTADRQYVRLQVNNTGLNDELLLYSDANASNAYDAYDAPKMMNTSSTSPAINLYTTVGSENLVIDGRNSLPLDVVIPVTFTTNEFASGIYSITANELTNLPSGVTVRIIDNGVETSLSDGGTYTFTADAGTTKTFGLVLRSPGFTTDVSNNSNNQFSVFVNANGKVLVNLNEKLNENTFISIFNAVGQQIIRQQITATTAEVNQALIPGVYLVQVNNGKISLTSKVIVR